MIALGIKIGVALLAFTLGFLVVVGPVLLAGYLVWVNRWRLRLSWQRLVAWRAWRDERRLYPEVETEPF